MKNKRDHSVVSINGFERNELTKEEALFLAKKMKKQIDTMGWRGDAMALDNEGRRVSETVVR